MVLRAFFFCIASAALASTIHAGESLRGAGHLRSLADFDWLVTPQAGYPILIDSFNENTTNPNAATKEAVFKYDVPEGLATSESKTVVAALYEADCSTIAQVPAVSITAQDSTSVDKEMTVDIDFDLATIRDSDYYTEDPVFGASANITFCLRVDVNYFGDSINFHETKVNIYVDLTSNFELTTIAVDYTDATQAQADANLNCEVLAYYCDAGYNAITPDPTFAQGDALQFCVKIHPNETNPWCCGLDTIMETDLDQASRFNGIQHADPITNFVPDPLTNLICENGICNVKTQLASKFFLENTPSVLNVTGSALLDPTCGDSSTPITITSAPTSTPTSTPTSLPTSSPTVACPFECCSDSDCLSPAGSICTENNVCACDSTKCESAITVNGEKSCSVQCDCPGDCVSGTCQNQPELNCDVSVALSTILFLYFLRRLTVSSLLPQIGL